MKNALRMATSAIALAITMMCLGCGSESPESQKLFIDAKQLYADINRAFTLPGRSKERVEMMSKILNEKFDEQVVIKLEQYLKEAPNGKHAKEATSLLEEARNSQNLRMIGQLRPLLGQGGAPRTVAGADSLTNSMQQKPIPDLKDTAGGK